ncbi:MAG: hypothetical protein GXP29_01040 [Planctomycetes bacterium]|nr:hypothetical protein [Planctomycetota bacterium]
MHILKRIFVLTAIAFASSNAIAAQVVPMSIKQMADHSGQVIVGRVETVRSYWAQNPRRIESEVTFNEVRVLKGQQANPEETFTLTVPGGQIDDLQMRVCCAPKFRAGDKWVLMLLPTYKTFPVVGVYRGAVRVKTDAMGVERVHNAAGIAITGIDNTGHLQLEGIAQTSAASHLVGTDGPRLKTVDRRSSEKSEAMRLSDFVELITPVLSQSRSHGQTQAAGKRLAADLRAVSFKRSPADQAAKRNTSGGRELPKPKQASTDPRGKAVQP